MEKVSEGSTTLASRGRRDFFYGMVLSLTTAALALPIRELLDNLPANSFDRVLFGVSLLGVISEVWGIRLLTRYMRNENGTYFRKLFAMLASIVALFSLAFLLWGFLLDL